MSCCLKVEMSIDPGGETTWLSEWYMDKKFNRYQDNYDTYDALKIGRTWQIVSIPLNTNAHHSGCLSSMNCWVIKRDDQQKAIVTANELIISEPTFYSLSANFLFKPNVVRIKLSDVVSCNVEQTGVEGHENIVVTYMGYDKKLKNSVEKIIFIVCLCLFYARD